jgi:hypothetical protein
MCRPTRCLVRPGSIRSDRTELGHAAGQHASLSSAAVRPAESRRRPPSSRAAPSARARCSPLAGRRHGSSRARTRTRHTALSLQTYVKMKFKKRVLASAWCLMERAEDECLPDEVGHGHTHTGRTAIWRRRQRPRPRRRRRQCADVDEDISTLTVPCCMPACRCRHVVLADGPDGAGGRVGVKDHGLAGADPAAWPRPRRRRARRGERLPCARAWLCWGTSTAAGACPTPRPPPCAPGLRN